MSDPSSPSTLVPHIVYAEVLAERDVLVAEVESLRALAADLATVNPRHHTAVVTLRDRARRLADAG